LNREMIYAITCDCPNRHNITVSPFEVAGELTQADFNEHARKVYEAINDDIRAGELWEECPFCSAPRKDWTFAAYRMKAHTLEEAIEQCSEGEAQRIADAKAARRRRMN
jgi:hypothetical protein